MRKVFNNIIAEGLVMKNRIDMIYLINCVESAGREVLAIKDDGGDNDRYLHLHNDTITQDEEDVELYKQLILS